VSIARTWGTTAAERAKAYPCDEIIDPADDLFRGVDVAAPASVTYRRLCHLKLAPYSYDWLDNRGRRSPHALVAGIDDLAVGDRMMTIFTLVAFRPDEHLTVRLTAPRGRRLFGDIAVSYAVVATSPSTCRLVAKLRVTRARSPLERVRGVLLAWGDLMMMRKQLLTLARLAERDAAATIPLGARRGRGAT
jgi:hypothetical protein